MSNKQLQLSESRLGLLKRNLSALINARGYRNAADFCKQHDMYLSTVNRIFNGETRNPSVALLEQLGDALKIDGLFLVMMDVTQIDPDKLTRDALISGLSSSGSMIDNIITAKDTLEKEIKMAIKVAKLQPNARSWTDDDMAEMVAKIVSTRFALDRTVNPMLTDEHEAEVVARELSRL